MEKSATWDIESVISELTQGMELANEVKRQLCPSRNSREACGFLVEKIVSCYDNALALLNYMALLENGGPNVLVSHSLIEGSQGNEVSEDQVHKDLSKKRKVQPRWSEKVHLCSATGSECQLDDGYYWRKYGQKDILGSNHPRAYYRCTHRHTQGCLATKQVKRTDNDPSAYEVIYRGKHSCVQERPRKNNENANVKMKKEESQNSLSKQVIGNETGPKVESENVATQFFSEPINLVGTSYSTQFLSPATSESYFSMSPVGHNFLSSEPEFAEIISNHSSNANFPLGDLDFLVDQVDLDSHFHDAAVDF